MKNMEIFEPAMCCSTGLCGVGVDPELLRISTVLNTLQKNGVTVGRYNLTSAPMAFVNNKPVNEFINVKGPDELPVITLDGEIIMEGRYPTNEEFISLLGLDNNIFETANTTPESSGGCCEGGNCC